MRYSLTCGVFDCLHEGHINLFKAMRRESDDIVIVLHDDKSTFENKGRCPVQSLGHRRNNLLQCGYVMRVYITSEANPGYALTSTIKLYKPAVYMRGDDWPDFPGRKVIEAAQIPIKLIAYTHGISTTQIRDRININRKEAVNES